MLQLYLSLWPSFGIGKNTQLINGETIIPINPPKIIEIKKLSRRSKQNHIAVQGSRLKVDRKNKTVPINGEVKSTITLANLFFLGEIM